MGALEALCLSIFSNLQESWSNVCQAARELATVFSVVFFVSKQFSNNSWSIGQNVPPQTEGISAHNWFIVNTKLDAISRAT